MVQLGFLGNLDYTADSSKAEAEKQKISEGLLMYWILCNVAHDYSEMIAKVIKNDKNYNFNFPEVSSAVNTYSTPGFTVGINPVRYSVFRVEKCCVQHGAPRTT